MMSIRLGVGNKEIGSQMDHSVHNKLVSFIWSIADDCLRDVYVRGKFCDVIYFI